MTRRRLPTCANVFDVSSLDFEPTVCDDFSSEEPTLPDQEATREEGALLTADDLYVDPEPLSCAPLASGAGKLPITEDGRPQRVSVSGTGSRGR